jgi:hypothetical protein
LKVISGNGTLRVVEDEKMNEIDQVDDVLALANRVVSDEAAEHRAHERGSLVSRAREYSNAGARRSMVEQNRSAFQSMGLDIRTDIERAFTQERMTRVAFMAEYESCKTSEN